MFVVPHLDPSMISQDAEPSINGYLFLYEVQSFGEC